ncbi:hypothetical protein C0J52_24747 [Blattella germanica]|nr:hypothetical protein C0J52_24747 [Blattella germanica]
MRGVTKEKMKSEFVVQMLKKYEIMFNTDIKINLQNNYMDSSSESFTHLVNRNKVCKLVQSQFRQEYNHQRNY